MHLWGNCRGVGITSLRDLNLKRAYDSDSDDMLDDFFIPALSSSVRYRRLAGFFSSTALAVAARGIQQFLINGGRMELICSARLSQEDVRAVSEAMEDPVKIVSTRMLSDLSSVADDFVKDHVAALAWMVANGRLSLKIAIVLGGDGVPLDRVAVENEGIFHQKVGILEDSEGNTLSFSGSDNESASGWIRHVEEFKVFRGWIDSENAYVQTDIAKFRKFWEETPHRTRVVAIDDAVRQKLIQLAPRDLSELDLARWRSTWKKKEMRQVKLWPHQLAAIESWVNNGRIGIMEMATGTGKTITALEALARTIDACGPVLVVISTPYSHLSRQWLSDFSRFKLDSYVLVADSSNSRWKNELANRILDSKSRRLLSQSIKSIAVFTTHDSLASDALMNLVRQADMNRFLIVDEVHGIGAPERKKALAPEYIYRLGLSATPRRWFDEEGTSAIYEFFGKSVYEFPLKEAISSMNPDTGRTYLTPYYYHPVPIELTSDELIEYAAVTEKISKSYFQTRDPAKREEYASLLYFKRQRILNDAENKYGALENILDQSKRIKHCLVYCSEKQIDKVLDLLSARTITAHKFTMEEGVVPSPEFEGLSERQSILREFAQGRLDVLVAIRCLDEGVDVPPARTAVLLCSTGNPRQFIQRRGRILRQFAGKDFATIYDLIVIPPGISQSGMNDYRDLELRIVRGELKRLREFAEDAWNRTDCLRVLHAIEADINRRSGS